MPARSRSCSAGVQQVEWARSLESTWTPSPGLAPLALGPGEQFPERQDEARQHVTAVEHLVLAYPSHLRGRRIGARGLRPGIDQPDQTYTRPEILPELALHLFGRVAL